MPRFKKRRVRRYRPSALVHSGAIRRLPRPRIEIDRGLAWYVIWTAPRAERRVAVALHNRGLATYAPVEALALVKRGKEVEIERPAVGRYLFIGLHGAYPEWGTVHDALEDRTASSGDFSYVWQGQELWVPTRNAVVSQPLGRILTSADGVALRVPAGDLQRLADGLSLFGEESTSRKRFAAGGACRAILGPFASFRGIVESADDYRVRALLDVFGRKTLVEFQSEQLEAA